MMLALSPVIIQSAYAEELGTTELQGNISPEVTDPQSTDLKETNEADVSEAVSSNESPENQQSSESEGAIEEASITSQPKAVEKKEPIKLESTKEKEESQKATSNKAQIKKKTTVSSNKKLTTQQNEEVEKPKVQVKAELKPSATSGFVFDFPNITGNAVSYPSGNPLVNSVLIDVTTDENYDFLMSVIEHEIYNEYLLYRVALVGIPETRVEMGEQMSFNLPANTSFKYDAANSTVNYRISLRVMGILEDEYDTGIVTINKQRNTAEITIDKKINPSTVTFENEGDSENQTYDWEIIDEDGNIVLIGIGNSVPSADLADLPEGDYTVNLTTKGDSQFGNIVQEKTKTDTFKMVYGDLLVTHTTIDLDGNETEVEAIASRERVGTAYTTKPIEIPGYKLVEKPANAKGEYTEEGVLVEYYYEIIRPNLTVKYVDENGKELHEPIKSKGVYGEDYDTNKKSFKGYELIAIPSNASGTFGEDDIVVTYVYRLIDDGEEGGDEGNEGSGGNEGSETGGSSGGDIDPSDPGSEGDGSTSNGGANEASKSGAWNYGSSAQLGSTGTLGELPQTGSQGMIATGFAGGIMALIGAVLLVARRKF